VELTRIVRSCTESSLSLDAVQGRLMNVSDASL
jgi:hypothetical protein